MVSRAKDSIRRHLSLLEKDGASKPGTKSNTLTKTVLQDVAVCLHYSGKAKTIEEMDKAIKKGVTKRNL